MEQTKIQRDMDAQEIKRIWQQLAIGTILALAGLLFWALQKPSQDGLKVDCYGQEKEIGNVTEGEDGIYS